MHQWIYICSEASPSPETNPRPDETTALNRILLNAAKYVLRPCKVCKFLTLIYRLVCLSQTVILKLFSEFIINAFCTIELYLRLEQAHSRFLYLFVIFV